MYRVWAVTCSLSSGETDDDILEMGVDDTGGDNIAVMLGCDGGGESNCSLLPRVAGSCKYMKRSHYFAIIILY